MKLADIRAFLFQPKWKLSFAQRFSFRSSFLLYFPITVDLNVNDNVKSMAILFQLQVHQAHLMNGFICFDNGMLEFHVLRHRLVLFWESKRGNKLIFLTHHGRQFGILFVSGVERLWKSFDVNINSFPQASPIALPKLHDSYRLPLEGFRFHSSTPNCFPYKCEMSWLAAVLMTVGHLTNLSCFNSSRVRWYSWFWLDTSCSSSNFSFASDLKPFWGMENFIFQWSRLNIFMSLPWDSSSLSSLPSIDSEDSRLEPSSTRAPTRKFLLTLTFSGSSSRSPFDICDMNFTRLHVVFSLPIKNLLNRRHGRHWTSLVDIWRRLPLHDLLQNARHQPESHSPSTVGQTLFLLISIKTLSSTENKRKETSTKMKSKSMVPVRRSYSFSFLL